jgi:hypothetical protein
VIELPEQSPSSLLYIVWRKTSAMQLAGLKKVQPSFHIHFFLSFTYCGGDQNTSNTIARSEKQASEKTLLSRFPFSPLVHSAEENRTNATSIALCFLFYFSSSSFARFRAFHSFAILGGWKCRRVGRAPRALVLAPTRELAKQVEREFMESAPMLSTICVYGGVPISTQQRQLQRGVDIAVGTPGRIIDLIDRGSLQLQNVCFLVLDEADQMLAVGFEEDVERILETMTHQRQTMLFSATMPPWVKKLSRKYLKNALTIDLVTSLLWVVLCFFYNTI